MIKFLLPRYFINSNQDIPIKRVLWCNGLVHRPTHQNFGLDPNSDIISKFSPYWDTGVNAWYLGHLCAKFKCLCPVLSIFYFTNTYGYCRVGRNTYLPQIFCSDFSWLYLWRRHNVMTYTLMPRKYISKMKCRSFK